MNKFARALSLFTAATAAVCIQADANAVCTAGQLDTAFGAASTGYVQAEPVFVNGNDSPFVGIAISPDNGIVMNSMIGADSSSTPITGIVKFKHGGVLDSSFGGFGIASPGGPTALAQGPVVTLTQDSAGNIVEVRADGSGITATRFSASGALDTTFGTLGSVSVAIENLAGTLIGATTLTDGSIVVAAAGTNPSAANLWQPVVIKFTNGGAPDTTFGAGGVSYIYPATLTDPKTWGRATGIVALPTGQLVVVGRFQLATNYRVAFAARLLANGSIDATFGNGGFAIVDMSPTDPFLQARQVAVLSDGRLVLNADNYDQTTGFHNPALIRLLPNGALDATFGSGGTVFLTSPAAPFGLWGYYLALQNNGKILLSGFIPNDAAGDSYTAAVWRYTSAGSLDTAFGTAGFTTVLPAGYSWSAAGDMVYSSGGKILFRIQAGQGQMNTSFLVRMDSGSGPGCH